MRDEFITAMVCQLELYPRESLRSETKTRGSCLSRAFHIL
jgi:hypothetical protein